MEKCIPSLKLPLLILIIFAVVTTGAYFFLAPTGAEITNSEIIRVFKLAGWFSGLAAALISFIIIGLLNLVRRLFDLRTMAALHAPVILLGILPWLIFSWQVTAEPRFTNLGIAIIDFIARPLLWGSLTAIVVTIIFGLFNLSTCKEK
jgi:hypothetical protein